MLLLLACAGPNAVTVDGIEAFGAVTSAWWFDGPTVEDSLFLTGEGLTPVGPVAFDAGLRLATDGEDCAREADFLRGWADNSAAVLAAYDEGVEAACAAIPDFLDAQAALDADLYPGASQLLNVSYCDPESISDPLCAFAKGEFEAGVDQPVWATLRYADGPDPAAAWDTDACTFVADGGDEDDHWALSTGTFTVDTVEDGDALTGALSGELILASEALAEDPTVLGTIDATFEAEACPMPDLAQLVVY